MPSSVARNTASSPISTGDSYTMQSLNSNLDLDTLDFEEADLPFEELSEDYSAMGLMDILKKKNKVGFIRSVADGKYFLATHTGFIFTKDVDVPLAAVSEAKTLVLAKYLNKKVMVRGPLAGGTLTVERIMSVPDLTVITDIMSKGRIAGQAYEDSSKTGLSDATIRLTSVGNGKIFRASSDRKGKYHINRLEAGQYLLEVSKVGYSKVAMQVTITKRKKLEQNVPMTLIAQQ
jgi:hypothetical protein